MKSADSWPLASLAGRWQGKGVDISPGKDLGPVTTPFVEDIVFEEKGMVQNHRQKLFALRYETSISRESDGAGFHHEMGYLLWCPENDEIMRCFAIPRGLSVCAGGYLGNKEEFLVEAREENPVYGIASSQFLFDEFRTIRFSCQYRLNQDDSWSYQQTTCMKVTGREGEFLHRDRCEFLRKQV